MKRWWFLFLILCCFSIGHAASAKSIALVVGNDDYTNLSDLQRAKEDSIGYRAFLEERGFVVTHLTDLNRRQMQSAIAQFVDSITPGDTVVFTYSGHGWSNGKTNFLAPTDTARAGTSTEIRLASIPVKNGVNGILDEISSRGPRLAVAILDACRDNPFRSLRGTRNIGIERGLAVVAPPSGMFVVYSAGAGQAALDRLGNSDPEPYSVFTRHFLSSLKDETNLVTAVKSTQLKVSKAAAEINHRQRPAYYDEVIGPACLENDCKAHGADKKPLEPVQVVALPAPVDLNASAARDWDAIKGIDSTLLLERFIATYPDTLYEILATEKLKSLKTATTQPEPVPSKPIQNSPAPVDPQLDPPVPKEPVNANAAFLSDTDSESLAAVRAMKPAWIQSGLKALGHYSGAVDGIMGRGTQSAVRAFQASIKRTETGSLLPEEIVILMKRAENSTDASSTRVLGLMYMAGVGVKRDATIAQTYLVRAVQRGSKEASANLAALRKKE